MIFKKNNKNANSIDESGTYSELGVDKEPSVQLVLWDQLNQVAKALFTTCDAEPQVALKAMRPLLDRLTAPHRLLEHLNACTNGVIAGDPEATRQLSDRLDALARSFPELLGTRGRILAEVENLDADAAEMENTNDALNSLSFDALARLGTAATIATLQNTSSRIDEMLDVILGLCMRTTASNRLIRSLTNEGAAGVGQALNQLRLLGRSMAPQPLMRTMGGSPPGMPGEIGIGFPGGIGGGFPGGIPGFPDGPQDPFRISDDIQDLIGMLRDPYRWDSTNWDHAPTWRDILDFQLEVIDLGEIVRIRCLLAMTEALKLRQEPPPRRTGRVVWAETITSITSNGACPGDQIVIHGNGFGPPSANRGVMLPMIERCQAFPVPASSWTPTAITIILPSGIGSGSVGVVDLAYVRIYNEWADRMNELMKRIISNAKCSGSTVPAIPSIHPFDQCAPATAVNQIRAGVPVIRAFKANGREIAAVLPGDPVTLRWNLRNVESFTLSRSSNVGPGFSGAASVTDPPGNQYMLGAYHANQAQNATYKLEAKGPCGTESTFVQVLVRKVPDIRIKGIEVTQAVQSFGDPNAPDNSVPLVAHKDTIVRTHVAVDNLHGFALKGIPDQVEVSGELIINGSLPTTPPFSRATARISTAINRQANDGTLDFRIPAALASGTMSIRVRVWTVDEFEVPPTAALRRPRASAQQSITWAQKRPFKVRYVLISAKGMPALKDEVAKAAILRGFDLLATPATDLVPAHLATWHTSADLSTRDGISTLLGHLDDQHDCSFSEWLFPWENECPDADGAVWLGIGNWSWGGMAQGYHPFNTSRNTAVAPLDRITIAHELGHTLSLKHVNRNVTCNKTPEGPFDTLPNGGSIQAGDAFDPTAGKPVKDVLLFDFMTYYCYRWVSRAQWLRVFNKF